MGCPLRTLTVRSCSRSGRSRSSGTARATTSTSSMPSLTWVIVTPESSDWSDSERSWGVSPMTLARSWSTTRRTALACSFQSNWTSAVLGLSRMALRTW
jgi:hypothetical protein